MTTAHSSNGVNGSSSSNAESSEREELPVGAAFDALKHPHRRYVLYHLSDRSEGASVGELAERIADWEAEAEAADEANGITDLERIAVALHHTHLPKLAEIGLIEYDRERDCITRREETADVEPYLEFAADYELVPN